MDQQKQPEQGQERQSLVSFLVEKKQDVLLFFLRFAGIFFGVLFPAGLGPGVYQLSLICFIAVYAIRLYQRLNGIQFSRAYFLKATMDDCGHYIIFGIIAFPQAPVVLVLLPFMANSLLAMVHFLSTLTNKTGQLGFLNRPIAYVTSKVQSILQFVVNVEIAILAMSIVRMVMMFSVFGVMSAFSYVHFTMLRCASQRNNLQGKFWGGVGVFCDSLSAHPRCPGFVRNAYYRVKSFFTQQLMALKQMQQQQTQQQ
eukprot:m.36100 g.36100  ORF g.36100 m.36100 type:complete len:255 (-) comp6645_c0_seq3:1929-2693(-)